MISIGNAELYKRHPHLLPQLHAKELDKLLGYRIQKIEVKLLQKYRAYYKVADEKSRKNHYGNTQTWIGLHPQVLQTPYNDIYEALSKLRNEPVSKIVDIGSAYGRVGLISNIIFPKARFIGYEIVKKRVDEANRVFDKYGLINCEVINTNVLDDDFVLPEAEVYFIYDFSEKEDIQKILSIICKKMKSKKFYLVARGDRLKSVLKRQVDFHSPKEMALADSLLKIYEIR